MQILRWEVVFQGMKLYFPALGDAIQWADTTLSAASEYGDQNPEVKIRAISTDDVKEGM